LAVEEPLEAGEHQEAGVVVLAAVVSDVVHQEVELEEASLVDEVVEEEYREVVGDSKSWSSLLVPVGCSFYSMISALGEYPWQKCGYYDAVQEVCCTVNLSLVGK
jgi:hypothetical protein